MNGVICSAELLLWEQTSQNLTSEQIDLVRIIKSSGEAMLVLINDILDLSKIEAGKLELESRQINIRDCIESTVDVLAQKAFAKGLALQAYVSSSTPITVFSDPVRLKQILFNLVSNAVKFTASGYVLLEVDATRRQLFSPREHALQLTGDLPQIASGSPSSLYSFKLTVTDSGIGISPQAQEKLFTNFTQAHQETSRLYGGTGLGLAITKSLVQLLGGTITLHSEEHVGSVFTVELPLLCAEMYPILPSPEASVAAAGFVVRHLVLHGNDRVATLLQKQLQDLPGHEVTTLNSLSQLRQLLQAQPAMLAQCAFVWIDYSSCVADGEIAYLKELFTLTRRLPTRVVAMVPLGTFLEPIKPMVDAILSLPVKTAAMFHIAQSLRGMVVQTPLNQEAALMEDSLQPTGSLLSSAPTSPSVQSASLLPAAAQLNRPQSSPMAPSMSSSPPAFHSPTSDASPSGGLTPVRPLAVECPLHILVAEDNVINQRLIARLLTRLGYRQEEFMMVGDGQQALEQVERNNLISQEGTLSTPAAVTGGSSEAASASEMPVAAATAWAGPAELATPFASSGLPQRRPFEMVFMDLQMPGLDGFSSTRCIRQLGSRIHQPFICALTANAMDGDSALCLQAGMNLYLSKPIQIAPVIQAIRLAHEQARITAPHA
jgi:CheY-like chemotaxis protein/two-component sensor histidine kinase